MDDNLDWSAPRGELAPLDRTQMLRDMDMHALRDSRAGEDRGAAVTSLAQQIEHWRDQHLARLREARVEEESGLRDRIRAADAADVVAGEHADTVERGYRSALARRNHLAAILRGERRGDDGGDWADRSRMNERRRLARALDLAVYGAAALAEVGLNYLAFQLMGAGPFETTLLAAAVVLVTVLLPAQLGVLTATARRTRRWTGWPLVVMGGVGLAWAGVLVFVAEVRTAYLLLPPEFGQPLVVVAGIRPWVLTVGWLVVGCAVGLTVLVRSALRHNPYASAWHAARHEVTRRGRVLSEARSEAERAAEHAARERDEFAAVPRRYAALADEARALSAELQNRYRHALARRRGSVEHCLTIDSELPALGPSTEEAGS